MATLPSRADAGSILLSSAASIVCCQVLVELGMTKPNWKYHSAAGEARANAQQHTGMTGTRWVPTARTFHQVSPQKDSLLKAEPLQHFHGGELELS